MKLRFLYKIWSNYDSFVPRKITERTSKGNILALGWNRYIDDAEPGSEVWIYFHGSHKFDNGVYAKGHITSTDFRKETVFLRLRRHTSDSPLTDPTTSRQIATLVEARGVQVFLFPYDWEPTPAYSSCRINTDGITCRARLCDECPIWLEFPRIRPTDLALPPQLEATRERLSAFVPAYWISPSRCYLGRNVTPSIQRISNVFYDFKTGNKVICYALALAIYESLMDEGLTSFDVIVPIPLSPDKLQAGETHRTKVLSRELSRLFQIPVREYLELTKPISKRRPPWNDLTPAQYLNAYLNRLEANPKLSRFRRILLIDDVCTWGTTLRAAVSAIHSANAQAEIVAATAGQMILKRVVRDDQLLRIN